MPNPHVADSDIRAQKQIIRHRASLVQDRTRAANRLTSMLDKYDIPISGGSVIRSSNLGSLSTISLKMPEDTIIMQQAIRQIQYLNDEIKKIEATVDKLGIQKRLCP